MSYTMECQLYVVRYKDFTSVIFRVYLNDIYNKYAFRHCGVSVSILKFIDDPQLMQGSVTRSRVDH